LSRSLQLAEAKALFRLGAPMAATQFFIMAMGFLDTAMAGHYASTDLAGVALGGNIYWPTFMLCSGVTMALTPMVAQLRGANRVNESGAIVRQGLWASAFAAVFCVLIVINAEPLFALAGVEAGATDVALRYLKAAAWGMPAVLLYVALRYTSEGLGKTLPPMLIAGTALPLNGLLNWIFIYGEFGFPALGGEGCGWATAIVMWCELGMISLLLRTSFFKAAGVSERFDWPNLAILKSIFRIGLPIGATVFLEMMVFSVIGFMVASLGVVSVAAYSIAGNVNWATYVIPMSIGGAASIRVGYFVGAGDYEQSRNVAKTAFALSLSYALVVSAILIFGRESIVTIYSNDPEVLTLAATLLIFIAVYQIVDDTQATMIGALRGYKDTRAPMLYSLLGYWVVAMPLGAALGFGWLGYEPWGVYGFWAGLTIGLSIVAVCVGVRLLRTSRNDSRIQALSGA
jgi:MATE family multidrug resistance protein